MKRYIKSFEDSEAIQNAVYNGELSKPYVAYNEDENVIDWNSITPLSEIPLTFEILGDGDIVWWTSDSSATRTIEYSINGGEWTEITSTTEDGILINVNSGDTVQFRGDNQSYATSNNSFNTFGSSVNFKAKGNIMSLINSTNFSTLDSIPSNWCFSRLFSNSIRLTDAKNLLLPATTLASRCYCDMFAYCSSLTQAPSILPATTLAMYCYYNMFKGCTSLTTAPELPATTLAMYCYNYMFFGCTSLTTAPELPATTLADACYQYMFDGCSSLTSAPSLPVTTLVNRCYNSMFNGCRSLNYIKCLATNISASSCTGTWVRNVAPTGTFVKNPNMNDWTTGINGIPNGWTVVDAEL